MSKAPEPPPSISSRAKREAWLYPLSPGPGFNNLLCSTDFILKGALDLFTVIAYQCPTTLSPTF